MARRPARIARAFTLIELLIVIGVIALMLSILLPVLWSARSMADSLLCLSNLRQLGHAMINYSNDYKGCLPGNSHDNDVVQPDGTHLNLGWMQLNWVQPPATKGYGIANQLIGGTLGKYLESSQRAYMCPTLKARDELGGNAVLCHYAVPTILSGLSVGLVQGAYYFDPLGSSGDANKRLLRGLPMIVEPQIAKNADGTMINCLGVYDPSTQNWTTLPQGNFETDDGNGFQPNRLACDRHLGKTNIGFHDGHAESVAFPNANITAADIFMVLTSGGSSKTMSLGGSANKFDDWFNKH